MDSGSFQDAGASHRHLRLYRDHSGDSIDRQNLAWSCTVPAAKVVDSGNDVVVVGDAVVHDAGTSQPLFLGGIGILALEFLD